MFLQEELPPSMPPQGASGGSDCNCPKQEAVSSRADLGLLGLLYRVIRKIIRMLRVRVGVDDKSDETMKTPHFHQKPTRQRIRITNKHAMMLIRP